MTQQQQGRAPTLKESVLNRIELAKQTHPNDVRAQHRAAEVSLWADWYRSGANAADRNDVYAHAAIMAADLFHVRPEGGRLDD